MATLVFTTIGTVFGGPIGGAIGALVGQAADTQIFKPAGREGPRLADLSVQTSRYGSSIPAVFGTMRIAGTVIWATDLREASGTSGGKGQPSVTSYSYSASFAVALSSRAISGIGRIWADGNLLRGSAGDMKSPLGALRIHPGGAAQAPDPLIAAAVGPDQAPAFRDMAYVVFEDLQLADFGNRIPSLTFEVTADATPVPVSAVAAALIGRGAPFIGASEPELVGYAADGATVADALAPLMAVYRLRWRVEDGEARIVDAAATGRTLSPDAELRSVDGRAEPLGTRRRAPIEQVPVRLALRYYDPERDYQLGVQSAERAGPGRRSDEQDLPAALAADTARQLADRNLRAALRERETRGWATGWSALDLQAGDVVTLEGERGDWLVETLEWADMAPRLSLRARQSDGNAPPATGDAGQPLRQPDLVQGPTSLAAVELVPVDDTLATAPLVYAAATGADAGWRRAALFRYRADAASAEPIGPTAPRAVIGTTTTILGDGAAWTFDLRNSVDIQLDNAADALIEADDDELLGGANLCAIGSELLQFGRAAALGEGAYRLSRLIRGWRGTEWASGGHDAAERFVLIDLNRLARIATGAADMGALLDLRASGAGDADPVQALLTLDGRAMLPPSPVQCVANRTADGDLALRWTRRSRLGWQWRDLVDVPLAEERENYQLTVMAGAATLRAVSLEAPAWTYMAADMTSDLATAGGVPLVIAIRQIGTHGPSRPLIIPIS